jgi:TatD DNase family protein
LIAIGAGYGYEDNQKTLAIAQANPGIYCAIGMHPHDAKLVTDENFAALRTLYDDPKVRAVGEIGLDYHYMNSPASVQQEVLARFVRLAVQLKKPIVVHDRDCGTECVDIVRVQGGAAVGGMVHCFTGSMELAQAYLELGYFVSFTGIITFKKSDALREVVKRVPLTRMLIETDSPFLTPIPHRGKKNEPAFVRHVAECVAQVKGVGVEEVGRVTSENAARLFGIAG